MANLNKLKELTDFANGILDENSPAFEIVQKSLEDTMQHLTKGKDINEYHKKITDELSGHIEAIELRMAEALVNANIEFIDADKTGYFTGSEKAWFNYYEYEDKTRAVTFGGEKGDWYKANATYVNNHNFGGETDKGRYGAFFEDFFFGGGGDSDPVPDFRYWLDGLQKGIEIKSKTEKEKKIEEAAIMEVKQEIQNKVISGFREHSLGKNNDYTQLLGALKGDNTDEIQLLKYVQRAVIEKFVLKAPALLVAGINAFESSDLSGKKILDIEKGQFINASGAFYFAALYLYYSLVIENLLKHVKESIKIDKTFGYLEKGESSGSKKWGAAKITARGEEMKIVEILVEIKASFLPDRELDIQTAIKKDPEYFYRGVKVMYDDAIASKTSKEFFNRIMTSYREYNARGNKNEQGKTYTFKN